MRIRAFAKINLSLEVLNRRPDGYHNLRTVLQTISLADTIDLSFTPGRTTRIVLESTEEIPDNLALRAADLVFSKTNPRGHVTISLVKKIPMGGGLGGGSTDAAAVLLALPVLTGRPLAPEPLFEIAATLGSDVPFFLVGGTALGLGRGTEIYPLADATPQPGLLVAPDIHVSTAEAYKSLNRSADPPADLRNAAAALAAALPDTWHAHACNDFEPAVFDRHPEICRIRERLARAGATLAMMSGSGASVFALFNWDEDRARALNAVSEHRAHKISLVTRRQYQRLWWRQLASHTQGQAWPPRSRYEK